ncbi:MAG: dihydroorotase [Gammaproteobacteria bacterium]|nr:dihydroorotase [Gammaproteobacteria bacterium]
MKQITLTRPDDWHVHFRDGDALGEIVPHHARRFGRAIVMPNLKPPVTSLNDAMAYRQRVVDAIPAGCDFTPLMTLYLTQKTSPEDIENAKQSGMIYGVKLYPAGATTNSDAGVTDIFALLPTLQAMTNVGLPLLIHAEVTDPAVDVFDREKSFLEQVVKPLLEKLPDLKVVLEHVTTADMANFVIDAGGHVGATVTPQHLLYNRSDIFRGGINPHLYCLPILKREQHRERLCEIVASGDPRFFLGTDSAPHSQHAKESACGCAGIFSAPCAIEVYAEIFESLGALEKLEGFASFHGADFYGLPRNESQITLINKPWTVPESFPMDNKNQLIPLKANETLHWQLV